MKTKHKLHIVLRDAASSKNRKFRLIPTDAVEFYPPRVIQFAPADNPHKEKQEIRHLRMKFTFEHRTYDFCEVVSAEVDHREYVRKLGYTVIPDRPIVGTKWMAPNGRIYSEKEVQHLDIDTPGPQFAGTVVRVEVSKCPNDDIEDWRVVEVQ